MKQITKSVLLIIILWLSFVTFCHSQVVITNDTIVKKEVKILRNQFSDYIEWLKVQEKNEFTNKILRRKRNNV